MKRIKNQGYFFWLVPLAKGRYRRQAPYVECFRNPGAQGGLKNSQKWPKMAKNGQKWPKMT